MEMNKVVKRGKRSEATRRIWVTFEESVYEALSKRSKDLGYTIGALTRLTLDRAVAAGFLSAENPSLRGTSVVSAALAEEYVGLTTGIRQEDRDRIRLLTEVVELQQQVIDQMQQRIDSHKETILRQAVELAIYETDGVTDAG